MINQSTQINDQALTDNLKGKFAFLASQLPGMSVQHLNGLQYVDSSRRSDTFNTVLGLPSCNKDIAEITHYYLQKNHPAAWWFDSSPNDFCQALQLAGWQPESHDVGMYLELTAPLKPVRPVLSRIEYCNSTVSFRDFGRVLSAIFEPHKPLEAQNIRYIYQQAGEHSAALTDRLVHLVGYVDNEPVTTAAVCLQGNVAGIFDIATPVAWRNQGFGSEIFHQALRIAQQQATLAVLLASPDGQNIYSKAGFTSFRNFEVWNLSHYA